ncbi:MAG: ATP-binding cassette domain-containing protein [Candidatus Binataceae bacterium]|nr:ATP-binding cassette domain-containing protein [Candidatus Binataceae bacterium]
MKSKKVVIEVANLRIERDNPILDRIDWRVEAGQHWTILGANGSGKTSLLSALTGYLPPTEGEISVLGQTYGRADWRELRTHVGIVSSSLHQLMDGHETALDILIGGLSAQIGYWGEIAPADRKKAVAALKKIESEYLRDRPWRFFSQGERQRVLIGRALIARPKLLILDEPCAGLDPVAREHFLQFIERLARNRSAPTLVLVTHHVEEIMPVFSHVLILKAGAVLTAGHKHAVLTSGGLSRAFDARLRLSRARGRYAVRVTPRAEVVI